MNVRIFRVRAMKCMCAQTRPRFILSSERVSGGMEFETMLTPREKSPVPENVPRGGSNPRCCGQRAQARPAELFRPLEGSIQGLYSLLTALRTVSNTYAQVARAQSCANHVQHIEWLSRATCCLSHCTEEQLSYQV